MDANNSEEALTEWNLELARNLIFNDCLIIIYLILGVIGNSAVIYFYMVKMKHINLDNRYFIAPLAIMDMLACIVGSSQALLLNLRPVTITSEYLCKGIWFTGQWVVGSSGLLLAVIAIQRYLKVCRPFGFQMTLPWKRAAIVGVIFASAGFSSPSLVYYGRMDVVHPSLNITGSTCGKLSQQFRSGLVIYNSVIFATAVSCILCLTCFYGLIGRTIYKQMKKHGKKNKYSNTESRHSKSLHSCSGVDSNQSEALTKGPPSRKCSMDEKSSSLRNANSANEQQQNNNRRKISTDKSSSIRFFASQNIKRQSTFNSVKKMFANHKYSWMFMTITIVFVIAFMPWNVITTMEALDPDFWNKLSGFRLAACLFAYRLFIVNHMANPFIYGFFDGAFRREIKEFVCRCKNDEED